MNQNGENSNVEFQDKWHKPADYSSGTPKIVKLLIKYSGGLVRDEKQAAFVLVGFVVLVVVLAIIIATSGGSNEPTALPTDKFVP